MNKKFSVLLLLLSLSSSSLLLQTLSYFFAYLSPAFRHLS